ncbi:MAG: tetratricopeptide repeat protein [Verrucomicrobiota bacterium]
MRRSTGSLTSVVISIVLLLLPISGLAQFEREESVLEKIKRGLFAYRIADYPEAEKILEEVIEAFAGQEALAELGLTKEAKENCLFCIALSEVYQIKYEEALKTIESLEALNPTDVDMSVILFWKAMSQFQLANGEVAYNSFGQLLLKYPKSQHRNLSRLFMALSLLEIQEYEKLYKYLETPLGNLATPHDDERVLFQLLSLIQLERYEEAATLVSSYNLEERKPTMVTAMNLLTLELGNYYFESQDYVKALQILQRVWIKNRILYHQQKNVATLLEELDQIKLLKNPPLEEKIRVERELHLVKSEIEKLKQLEDYDTALNYRIAICFEQLKNYRASYMVLKRIVNKLPDSELLIESNFRMLNMLMYMGRWDDGIKAADAFAKRFPSSELLSEVIFMKAESQFELYDYRSAADTYYKLATEFASAPNAEEAHFKSAYNLLMAEYFKDALKRFEIHRQIFSAAKSSFKEDVDYWSAMTEYYMKEYDSARENFSIYQVNYPKGKYFEDTVYRQAHSLYLKKQFLEAYKELEAYFRKYPSGTPNTDEARNLMGDCLFALGDVENGIKAFQRTSIKEGRYYDYARFRIALAYKRLDQFKDMELAHKSFLEKRPDSPRVSEALKELAWIYRKNGDLQRAENVYWDAVFQYGNNPEALGVEDMFTTLSKFARKHNKLELYQAKLEGLAEEALEMGKKSYYARLLRAQAELNKRSNPAKYLAILNSIPEYVKPIEMSAIVLIEVADALRTSNRLEEAYQHYKTVLFWYPRSTLKKNSYIALGILAKKQGDLKEALRRFRQFERSSFGVHPLMAEMLRYRADLYQQQGHNEKAIQDLENILTLKQARGKSWVEALYKIGMIYKAKREYRKSIPYFQRIYILYGRWADYVAKAYWESSLAFEKLNLKQEASNTLNEMLGQDNLRQTQEYALAKQKIVLLPAADIVDASGGVR